jgi:hypothetical protein
MSRRLGDSHDNDDENVIHDSRVMGVVPVVGRHRRQ